MNFITAIFNNLSADEKSALQVAHDALAAQWDAASAPGRIALEQEFTQAINAIRVTE